MTRATGQWSRTTIGGCLAYTLAYTLLLGPLAVAVASASSVRAAGVVGTGDPTSCTEAALDTALLGGGLVTFNCGTGPVTLLVGSPKVPTETTAIDGGRLVTVSGGNATQLFVLNSAVSLTLTNLGIQGGSANLGGAITNFGSLTVDGCSFSGNRAQFGGAIANFGYLHASGSTFSQNAATSGAGALANDAAGTLIVTGCPVSLHEAAVSGGAIENNGGQVFLGDSSVLQHHAQEAGGAIHNISGSVSIEDSTFSRNTATAGGAVANDGAFQGTVTAVGSRFVENVATGAQSIAAAGGAFANSGSRMVDTTTIADNRAEGYDWAEGGGIDNSGELKIFDSTLSGNVATATVRSVVRGGGIYNNFYGHFTVANTTVFQNRAAAGGGIRNDAWSSSTDVRNCTFAANIADATNGGGISGPASLRNTIVANNTGGDCSAPRAAEDMGHNLDSDGSCGVGPPRDPLFDPGGLSDNGGPTKTVALQARSPAIGGGDSNVCKVIPISNVDQRGFARPGTGASTCSIGAYEYWLPDCCQCSASCAAPSDGLCHGCAVVLGASCAGSELCVAPTPPR